MIVQVSSTKEADAHSVEDYMDYIESLSMALLERVANLSDNNGNTSLHYAGKKFGFFFGDLSKNFNLIFL